MRLLLSELYKLLIKRRVILLLVALLAFEGISLCVSLENRVEADEDSAQVYKTYMTQFSGELTEEKVKAIEAVMEQRYAAEDKKAEIEAQFAKKEISADEFKSSLRDLKEETKGADGFNSFVNAYYTARDSEQFLADTTIWNVLLGNGGIDFFLVVALILSVVALTVYDEEIGINGLKFSTKKGKGSLITAQIIICGVLSTAVPLVVFFGRFFVARAFYGLDGMSNPLYTVEFFSASPWALTLGSAYTYLSLIKTLGCVYLGFVTMLIGQLCRSSLYTSFLGIITVYVPAYVLSSLWLRYMVPLPSSLLTAVGYFSAMELGNLSVVGEQVTMNEFSPQELQIYFSAIAAIIVLLMIINRLLWTKRRAVR